MKTIASILTLIALSVPLFADLPAFAIRTQDNTFKIYNDRYSYPTGSQDFGIVNDEFIDVVVRKSGDGIYDMVLWPKVPLQNVTFPWQPQMTQFSPDDKLYRPFWLGARLNNEDLCEWCWGASSTLSYPGSLFSPMGIQSDGNQTKLVAALNWPPKKCFVMMSKGRIAIQYDSESISQVGKKVVYRCIDRTINGDWYDAVDIYRAWLDPKMAAENLTHTPAQWMVDAHGYRGYGLMNAYNFSLDQTQSRVDDYGDIFPWFQAWGQMSNYAGDPAIAVPPLEPDEEVGCCLVDQGMHARYKTPENPLLTWIAGYKDNQSKRFGFYSRPNPELRLDSLDGRNWLNQWQTIHTISHGANAYYVDVIGAKYFGDALTVAKYIQTLSPNTFIESTVDIYAIPALVSGTVHTNGGPIENGGNAFPEFGRYLMNDRMFFFGESNGEHRRSGAANEYWSERLCWLLNLKFEFYNPNPVVREMTEIRDANNWWSRDLKFKGKKNLTVSDPRVDATWFDEDGTEVVVAVNMDQISGTTVTVNGNVIPIPSEKFSILTNSIN